MNLDGAATGPGGPATTTRLLRTAYILLAVLYWMSLYFYVPALPTYVESKTQSLAVVGVILAQYGLWQAIIRVPLGVAADWRGRRKPFILIGLALAGSGALLLGTANSPGGLFLGRAITGLAAGTWVPLLVAFSSLFPPEQSVRASAILVFAGSAGRVLSTSSTGGLTLLGGQSLPFVAATAAAASALLVALTIRERSHPPRRPSWAGTGRLMARRDVLVPSLLSLVGQYTNWAITLSFLPLLAEQLGADEMATSFLVSMNLIAFTVCSLLSALAAERLGARRLLRFAYPLMSGAVVLATLAPTLPFLFVAQLALGVGWGFIYSVLMGLSIRFVDDAQRTTAMGLHQAVYALGMFLGPWLSGVLADAIGLRPMFGVTAAVVLVAALLLLRLVPERPAD
jgi:MFS family permease